MADISKAERIDINLLSERKRQIGKQHARLAKIQVITGVVLAIYIGIFVFVGIVRGGIQLRVGQLEKKIDDEQFAIAQLKPLETMYTYVVHKYRLFDEAVETRILIKDILSEVEVLIPEGVVIDTIELEDGDEALRVTFRGVSVFETMELMDNLAYATEEDLEVVVIENLSREDDGTYVVTAQLSKEAV